MSEQITNKSNSHKKNEVAVRQFAVAAVLILSVAAALTLQQVWWTGFLLVEILLVAGCVELLARNLPRRIRRQMKNNVHRADGSKSKRRKDIEKASLRGFKANTLSCFTFSLIPLHACWLCWCFFLPQLERFNKSVVLREEDWLVTILLEPAVHILILLTIFSIIMYGSLKGIYLATLEELDTKVCERAERYAVYDLIHPLKQEPCRNAKSR